MGQKTSAPMVGGHPLPLAILGTDVRPERAVRTSVRREATLEEPCRRLRAADYGRRAAEKPPPPGRMRGWTRSPAGRRREGGPGSTSSATPGSVRLIQPARKGRVNHQAHRPCLVPRRLLPSSPSVAPPRGGGEGQDGRDAGGPLA